MNEAAIVAARREKEVITFDEIDFAIDRLQVGVFIALDGDTYFVKTAGGQQKWDDSRTTAASLCRYRIAASRGSSSAPFCLTADELSLARCPPSRPTGHEAETDRLLPTICAR